MGHSLVGVVRLYGRAADTADSDFPYRACTEGHRITALQASQMGHRLRTQFANVSSNQLPPIAKRIAENPKTVENKSFEAFCIAPEPEKRFARREAVRA